MKFFKHIAREKRLKSYIGLNKIIYDFPLTKVIKFTKNEYESVTSAVNIFLWESLKGSFKNKHFNLSKDLFMRYKKNLLKLPNRTPNGLILPYLENSKSYNILHKTLKDIFEKKNLFNNLSSFQKTFKVRLISSDGKLKNNSNYNTAKIHTDVWNYEPSSSVLFNIPLMGDTNAVGLNFFHPQKKIDVFNKHFSDYDEAKYLYKFLEKYSMPFKKGCIYISDAFSLHQTKYLGGEENNVRLSIDIRGMFKKKIGNEKFENLKKIPEKFIPLCEWKKISENKILVNNLPIDSFLRIQSGEKIIQNKIEIFSYSYSKSSLK